VPDDVGDLLDVYPGLAGLVLLVRLARDSQVMGPQAISRKLAIAGWAVAVIVGGFGLLAVIGAAEGTF